MLQNLNLRTLCCPEILVTLNLLSGKFTLFLPLARGLSVGASADGALGLHAGAVERATTVIGCDVNKPVKSSLHSEKVKI